MVEATPNKQHVEYALPCSTQRHKCARKHLEPYSDLSSIAFSTPFTADPASNPSLPRYDIRRKMDLLLSGLLTVHHEAPPE